MFGMTRTTNIVLGIFVGFILILGGFVIWDYDVMTQSKFWYDARYAFAVVLGMLGLGTLLYTTYYIYNVYHQNNNWK